MAIPCSTWAMSDSDRLREQMRRQIEFAEILAYERRREAMTPQPKPSAKCLGCGAREEVTTAAGAVCCAYCRGGK